METEGVELEFAPEAIRRVAHYAAKVNESSLNIGARRLYTIMETVLDEIMFEGADLADKHVTVTADYVERTLLNIVQNEDLSKYIL
jgi:ATP-dependent HslUV protease ATP-binding subunit HslU